MRILCLRSSIIHMFLKVSINFFIESKFVALHRSLIAASALLENDVRFYINFRSKLTITQNLNQLLGRSQTGSYDISQSDFLQILSSSQSLDSIKGLQPYTPLY